MKTYLEMLRVPGIVRITAAQLLARLPLGMLTLAIVLHVEGASESYALAGLVVAFLSVGEGVGMPVTARLAARLGLRRTLLGTAVVNAIAMLLLAFVPPDPVSMLFLGLVAGASMPPVMPVLRALYPRIVPGHVLPALFALDTTAQELIWIAGPVLATILATTLSTPIPLALSAAVTLIGIGWLITSPRIRDLEMPVGSGRFGQALIAPAVMLATLASFVLVASYMALELGIVAHFDGHGIMAGLAIAVSGLGSLIGGLALGHRRLGVPGITACLVLVTVGPVVLMFTQDLLLLMGALFLSGAGFAPAFSALYLMVSRVTDESMTAEAFGWLNTAGLIGGAAGTVAAGVLSDLSGPAGAFGVAALLGAVCIVIPAAWRLHGPIPGLSR